VRPGEPIWFDDGRIGGVIRAANAKGMTVEVTHAREGGERLASDKGINLPDSQLDLPALTEADLRNLPAVAQLADMVGLSFVQHAADVDLLRQHLLALNAGHIGIVLKIETRRAFENLPALLLSAMQSPAVGIMIARGDLAVECGFERLAEIQEELLWAAEAAHMPVIWATQVLETLAKTGMPDGLPARPQSLDCVCDAPTGAALEIVLGVDNIIFISILVGRLPPEQRDKARRLGLGFAMVSRLLLLFSLSWVMGLTDDLFHVLGQGISGRDLVLLFGGLFLLWKGVARNLRGSRSHAVKTTRRRARCRGAEGAQATGCSGPSSARSR
jgi:hypothetical protein